jgi:GDPmannose 4,6-dehydratase
MVERRRDCPHSGAWRDRGYAKEHAKALWLMLQQPQPDDYVIATGEMRVVRELCEVAFSLVGVDWEHHVRVVERCFRPTKVGQLRGNASKVRERLGSEAQSPFRDLVPLMPKQDLTDADLQAAQRFPTDRP